MASFQTDDWVLISEWYQKDWAVGPGPYQIATVTIDDQFVTLKINVHDVFMYIEAEECVRVSGPRLTYAEKERLAMANEPWRKHRDQNLTEIFKPSPREAPDRPVPPKASAIQYVVTDVSVPAPARVPVRTWDYVGLDGNTYRETEYSDGFSSTVLVK